MLLEDSFDRMVATLQGNRATCPVLDLKLRCISEADSDWIAQACQFELRRLSHAEISLHLTSLDELRSRSPGSHCAILNTISVATSKATDAIKTSRFRQTLLDTYRENRLATPPTLQMNSRRHTARKKHDQRVDTLAERQLRDYKKKIDSLAQKLINERIGLPHPKPWESQKEVLNLDDEDSPSASWQLLVTEESNLRDRMRQYGPKMGPTEALAGSAK
ncbi:hypothetical protein AC579_2669 [Pseudocercospora musae]|uniref:Uncharacterized protein n=1 Tax=Pseudocercospora musae TaxID=113226 RepID=A0A139IVJ5_9PEZI|nr:hypothetical protein AC579_2669 [Pseudocercospora musae]KXT18671.1 hypothetical protein AC579_2669 [Pseudocercospora musae]KXT18672.1 hypothetical protein AC579_2669 [Pseudocercospora musae]KXT18673.1 hypothetical protein AC579_2669 [Pseudocercospora musae]